MPKIKYNYLLEKNIIVYLTQPLKQETLHSTVQTVPLHAVNFGTTSYPKLLAP